VLEILLDIACYNLKMKAQKFLRISGIGLVGLVGRADVEFGPVAQEASCERTLLAKKSCGGEVAKLKQEAFSRNATSCIVFTTAT
jgi:hypothetical protein